MVVAGAMSLAACGHGSSSGTPKSEAKAVVLVPPSNPEDVEAWRTFMGQALLSVTHDPNLHPYSFIVRRGDDPNAQQDRKNQATAIQMMLKSSVPAGNMIALTGPDSAKVADVINVAFKDPSSSTPRGLKVLFVGVPAKAEAARKAVSAAGAELQVLAVREP
jgi:hypothetical protein